MATARINCIDQREEKIVTGRHDTEKLGGKLREKMQTSVVLLTAAAYERKTQDVSRRCSVHRVLQRHSSHGKKLRDRTEIFAVNLN